LAIEQERQRRAATTLRGSRLSEAIRTRAQAYASVERAAGTKSSTIARRLGLSTGAVEHWFREGPMPEPVEESRASGPKEAEEIRRQIFEERQRFRQAKADLRRRRLSIALRQRAREHARTRAAAGKKLKSIAEEIGVTTLTLKPITANNTLEYAMRARRAFLHGHRAKRSGQTREARKHRSALKSMRHVAAGASSQLSRPAHRTRTLPAESLSANASLQEA